MATTTPIKVRESEWTPRQKQVLDLLTRGYTNSQIATTLDISLDGAKWHVSEIITRLGVTSRDEAADYWRAQTGLRARFFTAVRAMVPGATWGRWLAAGAATGVAAGFAAALVLAWPNDDSNLTSDPQVGAPDVSNPNVTAPSGNTVLSNGRSNYTYVPALAYVAPGGEAKLVDGAGATLASLLTGCEGLGSAKQGDVLNGGLRWSADGSSVYCLTDSLSVLGANSDGSNAATLFAANGCPSILDISISPDGAFVGCAGAVGSLATGVVRLTSASGSTQVPATMTRFAVSPAGNTVITAGDVIPDADGPGVGRGSWNVYAIDGTLIGSIADAYVAYPDIFAWTLDGSAFAYPGKSGLTIVDISNGWNVTSYPVSQAGRGPAVTWVLDDTALLLHGNEPMLVRRDGTQLPIPSSVAYETARVAPDGQHVVAARYLDSTSTTEMVVVDLAANTARPIPGSQERVSGMGFGPVMTFAGDSSRVCWLMSPTTNAVAKCADLDGDAFEVKAPYQVEPDVAGRGDYSVFWRAFSPNLTHVAYTTPGLADRSAQQVLWISELDGSNPVRIGDAQGVLPYEWQPDGVYRASHSY